MFEKGTKVLVDTGVTKLKGEIKDINLYRPKNEIYLVYVEDVNCSIWIGDKEMTELNRG